MLVLVVDPMVVVLAAGAIVTVFAVVVADGPVFEALSMMEFCVNEIDTVPSEVQETTTVITERVEEAEGVALHPEAVPVITKSPALMPVTAFEN